MTTAPHLSRSLTPIMLWGLGVGYVISGMYFGWNLGLSEGGTLGLAIATFFIIIMYVTFTFSYAELACAIPKAGGTFVYAGKALGKKWGFIAGVAQLVEFVFAPPAIATAIGAYFNIFFPQIPVVAIAVFAYMLFTALNIYGVKAAASFELIITILAVAELLIFAGVTLPHFEFSNLQQNAFPNGIKGIFAAIPFAIWFFLGIEGVANVAEETINPQKNILNGCNNLLYHLLITIGLLGLVASFHGIILAAGRAGFEFGRVGYMPQKIGLIHPKFKTPANALLLNMVIGIIALTIFNFYLALVYFAILAVALLLTDVTRFQVGSPKTEAESS